MLVDIEYAERLSPQLRLYQVTKPHPYVARFRCPICLDSKQDQKKARGYFYQKMINIASPATRVNHAKYGAHPRSY